MKNIVKLIACSCLILNGCQKNKEDCSTWPAGFENFNRVIDGKKEGVHITLDSAGNFRYIITYKNNVAEGQSLVFYPTGVLKNKMMFSNDKANGAGYTFYPSGVIESIREWVNDKKVGYALDYYDTTGETKASLLYNNDGFLIQRKTYKKDGTLIEEEISKTYKEQLKR